jgi:hypothetical protein
MGTMPDLTRKQLALLTALAQNRGELDPVRLQDLLRRLAALEPAPGRDAATAGRGARPSRVPGSAEA